MLETKLKGLEKKKALLKQLGDAIGVNGSYIRAYESGKRNPKFDNIEKIAAALDVSASDIIGRELK